MLQLLSLEDKLGVLRAEKVELKKSSNRLVKQVENMQANLDKYNKEAVQVHNLCSSYKLYFQLWIFFNGYRYLQDSWLSGVKNYY